MWRLFFEIRKIKFLLTRNKSFCYLCILSFLITKSDKIVASKCGKKTREKYVYLIIIYTRIINTE